MHVTAISLNFGIFEERSGVMSMFCPVSECEEVQTSRRRMKQSRSGDVIRLHHSEKSRKVGNCTGANHVKHAFYPPSQPINDFIPRCYGEFGVFTFSSNPQPPSPFQPSFRLQYFKTTSHFKSIWTYSVRWCILGS